MKWLINKSVQKPACANLDAVGQKAFGHEISSLVVDQKEKMN